MASLKQALTDELSRLDTDDDKVLADALGMSCLLLGRSPEQAQLPDQFRGQLERVVALAAHDSSTVRKNAMAVITATCNGLEDGPSFMDVGTALTTIQEASIQHKDDTSALINTMYVLAELAGSSAEHAEAFCAAGAGGAVQVASSSGEDMALAEGAMHVLCSCASSSKASWPHLRRLGAISAAVGLLLAPQPDVAVRAAMLVGMLCGHDPAAQVELASTPRAVPALMAIVRQGSDADAKAIASDLFKLLTSNADAKPLVVAALRGDVTEKEQHFL